MHAARERNQIITGVPELVRAPFSSLPLLTSLWLRRAAEFQARRESARSALPSASPVSSKKQKTDVSDSPRKQTGFSGSEDDLPRPVPDSPKKSVPSAPKGFGELKDLLSAAAPVGSRRRTQRPGAAS